MYHKVKFASKMRDFVRIFAIFYSAYLGDMAGVANFESVYEGTRPTSIISRAKEVMSICVANWPTDKSECPIGGVEPQPIKIA